MPAARRPPPTRFTRKQAPASTCTPSPPTSRHKSEVRRVAAEVLAALPRIEVLINNVGGYWNTRHTSVDGIEHTFAVSHMAPYLLTNLLVERLVATGSARIVNVASNAQALGRIDFDDLQGERGYSGARAYHQSKLANVLFTYELARRLATRRVRATPCTREWSVPDSERRIPDASHGFSSR
ncbi:SDR family NAD(P)-dependent oxidoreductase [Nocardioides sp.]|uniref:SDR family NAD(P)-dependent oxidoreductase n=1 Tax=Nocardioides sp. TaxID=35761 RepID=UPI00344BF2BA